MTGDEKTIIKYLLSTNDNPKSVKFDLEKGACSKIGLDKIFNTTLDCKHYDDVTSGEGSEKEKIDTIYSSSLQSLLVFDKISKKNKIKIEFSDETLEFDEVLFEYQNPVIGYPSSIDVVLLNGNKKIICFIESKLFEIIRDSSEEGKDVVGISYFRQNGTGYKNTLHLESNELRQLGIDFQGDYLDKYRGLPKENGGGDKKITKIGNNEYVYSEGIKQILSHIIGICNFIDPKEKSAYKDCLDPLAECKGFKVYYLELYNALPKICEEEFKTKISNFRSHAEKVFDVLKNKKLGIIMQISTYQELYAQNSKRQDDYFNSGVISKKIIDFYKLNEE